MTESRHYKQTEEPKKKKKYKIRWLRIFLALFVVLAIVGSGVIFGVIAGAMKGVPSLDEATLGNYDVTSYILDKDNNYVDKLHATENRIPVAYNDISPNMIQALVAIEDQRFFKHPGVDPIRIAGAMVANVKAGKVVQGGSTITQQLAGLAMLDRNEKSYTRKIQEAVIALKIERLYSKEEIITHYLNRAYFGQSAYGVEAAANTFFGKKAKDLDVAESALLAGMIQNPSKWSPISKPDNALKRRAVVLGEMVKTKAITQAQADAFKEQPITLAEMTATTNANEPMAYANQSFIDHVINEALVDLDLQDNSKQLYTGGYIIHTTLDPKLQNKMEDVYNTDNNFPKGDGNNIIQSAMVMMDPKTGAVRGLVGGRDQTGLRNLNRATQSVRQPGSAFKPIAVYGPAYELGYSPGSVMDDYPKTYGGHMFKNYDNKYRGLMTYREAIKNSTNVMAVRVLEQIGINEGFKFAENLGITSLVSDGATNDMNLSMGLGGLTQGVSPLEMAGAYGAFANKGVYNKPHVITQITTADGKVIWEYKDEKKTVMSEETAYLVNSSLVSVISESGGTGARAALKDGRPTAGKTGTTSDRKDYWFTGYTPQYVGIVWMGYDQPKKITSITSAGASCGPIFSNIMSYAHANLPVEKFEKPAGITSVTIDTKSGLLPSELTPSEYRKSELFNKKHVPKETSEAWVQVEIDPLSGELFTPNCPGTPELKTCLKRAVPWQNNAVGGITPLDASLEAPVACTLHADGAAAKGDFFLTATGKYSVENKLSSTELYWQALPNNDNVSYEIHRSGKGGFTADNSTLLGSTGSTAYSDNKISDKNIYKIIAVDKTTHERVATSNEVYVPATPSATKPGDKPVTTPDQETPIPENDKTSSSLSLSGHSSGGKVSLNWSKPGNGDYKYFVFRSESADFSPNSNTQIGKKNVITGTSFTDTSAVTGTTYYYQLIASSKKTDAQVAVSDTISVQN